MPTLKDAERSAGVHSMARRGSDSAVIDICIVDTSNENESDERKLTATLREVTRCKSLFLDPGCSGTLVALYFGEAYLAWKVFKALKRNGYTPAYRRKFRNPFRRVRLLSA